MAPELSEEEEDAQQVKLGGGFQNAQCLLNAEVVNILKQRLQFMEDQGTEVTTTAVFDKSKAYAERFQKYNAREAAMEVRKALAKKGLKQFEICTVGNLLPQTAAEAKALQASLADPYRKDGQGHPCPLEDDDIEVLIQEMSNHKRFSDA